MPRLRRALIVLAAVMPSCSRPPAASSPTPMVAATTVQAASNTTRDVTIAVTNAAPSTMPTTTSISDTTTSISDTTTSISDTTALAASTTTAAPPTSLAPISDSLLLVSDRGLVRYEPTTDTVENVSSEFQREAVYRSDVQVGADGRLFFVEAYEDSWYSCASSVGMVGAVDLSTGAESELVPGFDLDLSPDGSRLAVVTTRTCLPDPQAPDSWVLTPGDRVWVADLDGANSVEVAVATPPESSDDPNSIVGVVFDGPEHVLVASADMTVRRVPVDASGVIDDGPVVAELAAVADIAIELVDATNGVLTAIADDYEGVREIVQVELASGLTTLVATAEGQIAVAVAPGGRVVVVTPSPLAWHDESVVSEVVVEFDWVDGVAIESTR